MIDNATPPLTLKIQNREGIIYESSIQSLTARNRKGKFDILSLHANFISLVDQTLLITNAEGQKEQMSIRNGILRVVENRIEIFLGFFNDNDEGHPLAPKT